MLISCLANIISFSTSHASIAPMTSTLTIPRKARITAFVSATPLGHFRKPCLSIPHSPPRRSRTPRTCSWSMKKKGFGKSKQKQGKNNPQPQQKVEKPVKPDEPYIPRGPTLRAEYERRGVIEPQFGPDAGVLPQIVADRMLRRILTFGAAPLGLLFAFFAAYFVLKYKYDITVIPVVVAYSTLGAIALATMGISYGIFSSSWDEDQEGTKLGWKEAKTNFTRAKDGLLGARDKEKREEEFAKIDQLSDDE